jgi:hypothetical protein
MSKYIVIIVLIASSLFVHGEGAEFRFTMTVLVLNGDSLPLNNTEIIVQNRKYTTDSLGYFSHEYSYYTPCPSGIDFNDPKQKKDFEQLEKNFNSDIVYHYQNKTFNITNPYIIGTGIEYTSVIVFP